MNNKDWTGNKKTMGVILGASNHSDKDREINDYYATHPNAVKIFLDKIKIDGIELNHNIIEQSVGAGHMANVISEYGHNVIGMDLFDRGYPNVIVQDFLTIDKNNPPYNIVDFDFMTNPPFKYAEKFVEKSMELLQNGNKLILFLKIQFLESKSRNELFKKYPPKYVYINSSRQLCAQNGEFEKYNATALCYCWYIWEKGYTGNTILKWID